MLSRERARIISGHLRISSENEERKRGKDVLNECQLLDLGLKP